MYFNQIRTTTQETLNKSLLMFFFNYMSKNYQHIKNKRGKNRKKKKKKKKECKLHYRTQEKVNFRVLLYLDVQTNYINMT